MPDPNVMVVKNLNVFPVEVVVRGYITGVTETAAWTAYQKGERTFCGNVLPEGLKKNQKFEKPIITPTTKSPAHDEQISAEEIVKRKLMTQEQWDYLAEKALKLFERGTGFTDKNGLIPKQFAAVQEHRRLLTPVHRGAHCFDPTFFQNVNFLARFALQTNHLARIELARDHSRYQNIKHVSG